jgi:osmotically-inducible protein OsmY
LTDLKCSGESKELILTATKEELESASPAPTGGWMAVAGEDWVKNVDRFYGQPSLTTQSRYERQEATGMTEGLEPVRNPAEQNGAAGLMDQPPAANPGATNVVTALTDDYIMKKVNEVIHQDVGTGANDIQVTIKNGVVTLRGKVANEAQKQALEKQIKALAGVDRVEDRLQMQTPQE